MIVRLKYKLKKDGIIAICEKNEWYLDVFFKYIVSPNK